MAQEEKKKSDLITHGRRLNDLGLALVESVYEAGGTDEDARRIFKDPYLRQELGLLVTGRICIAKILFPVWKTVKIGTGLKTVDDFRAVFKDDCYHFENSESEIMLRNSSFQVATEVKEVDLIKVPVGLLGNLPGTELGYIIQRAQSFGLGLCSIEIALQLRLQYGRDDEQPDGEELVIAMEPVFGFDNRLRLFTIAHLTGPGLCIGSSPGFGSSFYTARRELVFVAQQADTNE